MGPVVMAVERRPEEIRGQGVGRRVDPVEVVATVECGQGDKPAHFRLPSHTARNSAPACGTCAERLPVALGARGKAARAVFRDRLPERRDLIRKEERALFCAQLGWDAPMGLSGDVTAGRD